MSHDTDDKDMTQRLASEFVRIIRDWLAPEEMAEVLRRNQTYTANACATHDFCDANMAMAEAFVQVSGRACRLDCDADAALWNAAWRLAKNTEFR